MSVFNIFFAFELSLFMHFAIISYVWVAWLRLRHHLPLCDFERAADHHVHAEVPENVSVVLWHVYLNTQIVFEVFVYVFHIFIFVAVWDADVPLVKLLKRPYHQSLVALPHPSTLIKERHRHWSINKALPVWKFEVRNGRIQRFRQQNNGQHQSRITWQILYFDPGFVWESLGFGLVDSWLFGNRIEIDLIIIKLHVLSEYMGPWITKLTYSFTTKVEASFNLDIHRHYFDRFRFFFFFAAVVVVAFAFFLFGLLNPEIKAIKCFCKCA